MEYKSINVIVQIRRTLWMLVAMLALGCSAFLTACANSKDGKIVEIIKRDTLLVGTTGDYRPLSFRESDGSYWGFGIEVAKEIAKELGVGIAFIQTSWPTTNVRIRMATSGTRSMAAASAADRPQAASISIIRGKSS